jgi:cytochrome c biogenesis protein CcmG/thiol:disulfide interchange protein DsbE
MSQQIDAQEDRKLKAGRIVTWALVAGVIIFLGLGLTRALASQPEEGKAPDFTLETYDGQTYKLSDLRGQVVVINFWASWCVPCAEEAPDLEAAWNNYKDQGVIFLGIGYVDSKEKALVFMEEHGVTYPNGADLGTRISDDYNIRGVPETFVINGNGEVTFFAERALTYAELSQEIEKALASS